MSAWEVYGDESINQKVGIYGLIIVPIHVVAEAERRLGEAKALLGVPRNAKLHLRTLFNSYARAKTPWRTLNNDQAMQAVLNITKALGGIGIRTRVVWTDFSEWPDNIPGVGDLSGIPISPSKKQAIPFLYQCAVAGLDIDTEFKNQYAIWIDPDRTKIKWGNKKIQVERSLRTNWIDPTTKTVISGAIPKNLGTGRAPVLCDLADLLCYASARFLAKKPVDEQNKLDAIFSEIHKMMSPTMIEFHLLPTDQMQTGELKDYKFLR